MPAKAAPIASSDLSSRTYGLEEGGEAGGHTLLAVLSLSRVAPFAAFYLISHHLTTFTTHQRRSNDEIPSSSPDTMYYYKSYVRIFADEMKDTTTHTVTITETTKGMPSLPFKAFPFSIRHV